MQDIRLFHLRFLIVYYFDLLKHFITFLQFIRPLKFLFWSKTIRLSFKRRRFRRFDNQPMSIDYNQFIAPITKDEYFWRATLMLL